jgi:hypothetical protein
VKARAFADRVFDAAAFEILAFGLLLTWPNDVSTTAPNTMPAAKPIATFL